MDVKRASKYLFLLPTNTRTTPEDFSKYFGTGSIEIQFFGVQGTVLDAPLQNDQLTEKQDNV